MKFLVAVHGVRGQTISPEELFSRLCARWMWVKDRKQPAKNETLPPEDVDVKTVAVGMCVAESRSLADLNAELVKMPGAGIIRIEIYPLAA
jgi:hypothetical protein